MGVVKPNSISTPIWIVILLLIASILYVLWNDQNSIFLCWLFTFFNGIILVHAVLFKMTQRHFFSLVNIANFFLFFVFVVRAIQILLTSNPESDIYAISLYNNYMQTCMFSDLPIAQAAFIGLLGCGFLNLSFFLSPIKNATEHVAMNVNEPKSFNTTQTTNVLFILLISSFSVASYCIQIFRNQPVHMINIIWIYLFSLVIVYIIYEKKNPNWLVYFLIGLSIFLFSFVGKRQYVVNLLICYIIPLYYVGTNRKKIMRKIFFMTITLLLVVWFYGIIRLQMLGGKSSNMFYLELLNEFCMFDMLVVSLKYFNSFITDYFWGYNYLTVFTLPIPGFSITSFDHLLTNMVLHGAFHGGIPVTLFGSLFFNFSYMGLIIGVCFCGTFLRYLEGLFIQMNCLKDVMFFTIWATFVYDLIRVGNLGREIWTLLMMFLVAKFFLVVTQKNR